MKFRLTRPAITDLAEIGRYSRVNWGDAQARRYRLALTERMLWLCENRTLWHARPELGEGIYSQPEQSHVIIFREYNRGIEILRVLHGRMEPESRTRTEKGGT